MKAGLWLAALIAVVAAAQATGAPARMQPLRNPALLNIGFVCRWQPRCIKIQEKAMARTLKFMKKYPPAPWKVQLCNRNAARNGTRKDWVGFENCLKNPALRPPAKSRKRRSS